MHFLLYLAGKSPCRRSKYTRRRRGECELGISMEKCLYWKTPLSSFTSSICTSPSVHVPGTGFVPAKSKDDIPTASLVCPTSVPTPCTKLRSFLVIHHGSAGAGGVGSNGAASGLRMIGSSLVCSFHHSYTNMPPSIAFILSQRPPVMMEERAYCQYPNGSSLSRD